LVSGLSINRTSIALVAAFMYPSTMTVGRKILTKNPLFKAISLHGLTGPLE
jgi:hypothetical protein